MACCQYFFTLAVLYIGCSLVFFINTDYDDYNNMYILSAVCQLFPPLKSVPVRHMATSLTTLSMDLSQFRIPYSSTCFTEDQLVSHSNPYVQFHSWFEEATKCQEIAEPNAMCLSTVGNDRKPSSRVVLMKGYSESEGIRFFTNHLSRKGKEMASNNYVCLLFYWAPLHKQVRIEGKTSLLNRSKVEQYFWSRPRLSQISAIASPQSQPVSSREKLERMHAELYQKYSDETIKIPVPDNWGGYLVHPTMFEFWQGQSTRLHDRIVFQYHGSGWSIQRLAP